MKISVMERVSLLLPALKIALIDGMVFLLIFLLPTIAHLTTLPVWMVEPMRLVFLAAWFITRNKTNTLVIAWLIPLFSFAVTGHPGLLKALLIGAELFLNVIFLSLLLRRSLSLLISLAVSMVLSKICYYFLKFLMISMGFLEMDLFSTSIPVQLFGVAFISLLLFFLFRKSGFMAPERLPKKPTGNDKTKLLQK